MISKGFLTDNPGTTRILIIFLSPLGILWQKFMYSLVMCWITESVIRLTKTSTNGGSWAMGKIVLFLLPNVDFVQGGVISLFVQ